MPMNNRLLRPRASGFNPRSISGLSLWLDISDTASIGPTSFGVGAVANNGPVKYVADKSGNGRHATNTGADSVCPTYLASGQNGRGALSFDGGDFLDGSSSPISQPFTIYAVFRATDTAANKNLFTGSRSATNNSAVALFASSTETLGIYAGLTLATTSSVAATSVATCVFNGAASIIRNGGTQVASGSVGNTAFSPSSEGWRLGRFPTGTGDFFNGLFCELLLFSSAHSSNQMRVVERWLGSRWSVAVS